MTKYYAVGPQIGYDNYGAPSAEAMGGEVSYGYLTGGEITLNDTDQIEIKYRSRVSGGNKYFLDAETLTDRAYIFANVDTLSPSPKYSSTKIDGIETTSIPTDLLSHTILLTCNADANNKLYYFGQRYSDTERASLIFESIKLNSVDLDITWVDRIRVGGQTDSVAKFEGNHFLTLDDARDALPAPASIVEDYEFDLVSDYVNAIRHATPADMNGFHLAYRGEGYRFLSNINTYDIDIVLFGGSLSIKGFAFKFLIDKIAGLRSVILTNNSTSTNVEISDNSFDYNNKVGNGIYIFKYNTFTINILNNTFQNSSIPAAASYGGVWFSASTTGVCNVCNNVFYSVGTPLKNSTSTTVHLTNNYFDGDSAVSLVDYSWEGGNATSDGSADDVNLRDIATTDAFADPAGGDFTPKLVLRHGVTPIVAGHTRYKNGVVMRAPYYIGALGVKGGGGGGAGKRKKLKIMLLDE